MTEDGKEPNKFPEDNVENNLDAKNAPTKEQEYTDEELKAKINDLLNQEEELRKKAIEYLRQLPAQKVLSKKELEILMSLKEEELTEDDKIRVKWATLRLRHHRYTGTGYSNTDRKKAKLKRKMAKKSRKANR